MPFHATLIFGAGQRLGVYVRRDGEFTRWWVGVKQPGCSASPPKASQA